MADRKGNVTFGSIKRIMASRTRNVTFLMPCTGQTLTCSVRLKALEIEGDGERLMSVGLKAVGLKALGSLSPIMTWEAYWEAVR